MVQRLDWYRELEDLRSAGGPRALLVYVTSTRPNLEALISLEVIPEFLEQLEALSRLEPAPTGVDLLIVSNGGDPTVAWRMMTLLRERVKNVGVLVPQAAFSAATFLALGADEIVMHPNGNLGPIDGQYVLPGGPGFAGLGPPVSSAMVGQLMQYATAQGVTLPAHLGRLFDRLCREMGPMELGRVARIAQWTRRSRG